jgi:hypothetical protein
MEAEQVSPHLNNRLLFARHALAYPEPQETSQETFRNGHAQFRTYLSTVAINSSPLPPVHLPVLLGALFSNKPLPICLSMSVPLCLESFSTH